VPVRLPPVVSNPEKVALPEAELKTTLLK